MKPEIFISIIALLVALGSAIASWRVSRRQALVQEYMLSLESRRERDRRAELSRAGVRAEIQRQDGNNWVLRIVNDGVAQARALNLRIDGIDAQESPHLIGAKEQVRVLGPSATVKYYLLAVFGGPTGWDVSLEWEDDSGVPGRWHSQLTL